MLDHDAAKTPDRDLWLIGIAASAGGLEAIRALLNAAPDDAPAAWIVVQHMSPSHRSMLAQIIARETHLEVNELTDPVVPQPGHVYVVPPRRDVTVEDGQIVLREASQEPAAPKPSANRLFESLAREWGRQAIGIVLSGTGSDGARGIEAIHQAEGLTFAQEPGSANYDGMPNAAVLTGCVDLILPPVKIAERLAGLGISTALAMRTPDAADDRTPVQEILHLLLERTKTDFADYKPTTVVRRIERRMNAVLAKSLPAYADHCRTHPKELDALFQDLLISVTSFFRDPDEFAAMVPVFAGLAAKPPETPLRIWSAGCATGEEAYTIAIMLAEALGGVEALRQRSVQILASDIDPIALNQARSGRYDKSALDAVPEELAARYFIDTGSTVDVVPALKQAVVFSQHNVIQDPPFIKLDLICCRNLLIYFSSSLQGDALHTFHYSLNQDGVLFLGTAENVTVSQDLFQPWGASKRVFRKNSSASLGTVLPRRRIVPGRAPGHTPPQNIRQAEIPSPSANPVNGLVKALLSAMDRPALLLDRELQILSVFGDANGFISLRDGSAPRMDHNLLVDPLPQDVRLLAARAWKSRRAETGLPHVLHGFETPVSVTVFPLEHADLNERYVLVAFAVGQPPEAEDQDAQALTPVPSAASDDETVRQLAATQEALETTLEEWETANEELRCLNQELQANNEELQTINEELETSNEELQSTNEELVTVNQSARVAHEEVNTLKNDLETILREVDVPLLIVNKALKVTRTSEAADQIFATGDRPETHISQIGLPPGCPPLAAIADRVLTLGMPETVSYRDGGVETTLRLRPFASQHGAIIGLSIVLLARSAEDAEAGTA